MRQMYVVGATRFDNSTYVFLAEESGENVVAVRANHYIEYEIDTYLNRWRGIIPYSIHTVGLFIDAFGGSVDSIVAEVGDDKIPYGQITIRTAQDHEIVKITLDRAAALAAFYQMPILVPDTVLNEIGLPDANLDGWSSGQPLSPEQFEDMAKQTIQTQYFSLDEVVPGLYISGGMRMALPTDFQRENITHVLKLFYGDVVWPEGVSVIEHPLPDGRHINREHIQQGVDEIHNRREAGNHVLVACALGVSRSSTFVLAYLTQKLGYDLKSAWELLKRRHGRAWPAVQLWESLLAAYEYPYTLDDVREWLGIY